jgi:hypothetical protein
MILASGAIADERILNAVLDVVGDRTASRQMRLAALSVMWKYADSTRPISGVALLNANTPRAISGEATIGRKVFPGRSPVVGNARVRVADRARALAGVIADDPHVLLAFAQTADKFKAPGPVR